MSENKADDKEPEWPYDFKYKLISENDDGMRVFEIVSDEHPLYNGCVTGGPKKGSKIPPSRIIHPPNSR